MAVIEEPATLEEALASEDGPACRAAWESELESLWKNGTWMMEKTPKDRNLWDVDGFSEGRMTEGLRFVWWRKDT